MTSFYLTLNEVPIPTVGELHFSTITVDELPRQLRGAFDDCEEILFAPEVNFGGVYSPVLVCVDTHGVWREAYAVVVGAF